MSQPLWSASRRVPFIGARAALKLAALPIATALLVGVPASASAQADPQQPAAAEAPPPAPIAETAEATVPATGEAQAVAQAAPDGLNFTDARTRKERVAREVSLFAFSCEFGVQDLGDDQVDRVGRLRAELVKAYGDRLAGRALVLDHYHLYLNTHAMRAANNMAVAVFGLFALGSGTGAKTTKPGCARDKMEGWFDPAELTTPWSPFIVEMELHVDGQEHRIHSVYSPPKNMSVPGILAKFDMPAQAAAVAVAVDRANAAMVAEVGKQLDGTPPPAE